MPDTTLTLDGHTLTARETWRETDKGGRWTRNQWMDCPADGAMQYHGSGRFSCQHGHWMVSSTSASDWPTIRGYAPPGPPPEPPPVFQGPYQEHADLSGHQVLDGDLTCPDGPAIYIVGSWSCAHGSWLIEWPRR